MATMRKTLFMIGSLYKGRLFTREFTREARNQKGTRKAEDTRV